MVNEIPKNPKNMVKEVIIEILLMVMVKEGIIEVLMVMVKEGIKAWWSWLTKYFKNYIYLM